MTVIAVDGGNPVASNTPSATSIGVLYPGERMDIIVERTIAPRATGSDMKQKSKIESSLVIILDLEYVVIQQEKAIGTVGNVLTHYIQTETSGSQISRLHRGNPSLYCGVTTAVSISREMIPETATRSQSHIST
jgi:hypothetical protein